MDIALRLSYPEIYGRCKWRKDANARSTCENIVLCRLHNFRGHSAGHHFPFTRVGLKFVLEQRKIHLIWVGPANGARNVGFTFTFLSDDRDTITMRAHWSRFALSVLFARRAGIKRNPRIKRKFSRYIELLAYGRSLYFHTPDMYPSHPLSFSSKCGVNISRCIRNDTILERIYVCDYATFHERSLEGTFFSFVKQTKM